MIIYKRYVIALAIQGLGPLSMLALSLTITQAQGATAQGEFAATRAWIDLVVAVGLFGLPQSIVFAVNRAGVSRHLLFRWAVLYALGCLFIGGAAAWLTASAETVAASLAFAFAAATWILTSIWRGILLTIDDGVRFNLATVIPTLAVVVITTGVLLAKLPLGTNLEAIFAGAGAVALVICLAIVRRPVFEAEQIGRPPDYRQLFAQGLDVFILTVCSSLQVYLCYRMLGHFGMAADVGQMSIGLLMLNALNFPLQSVSPLLLNRWTKSTAVDALSAGRPQIRALAALFFALSAIAVVAGVVATPLLFKVGDYPPPAMWLLLFSVVPALLARTSALRLASLGEFRFNSKIAVLQMLFFAGGFLALAQITPLNPIEAAVAAWVAADVFAAVVFSFKLRVAMRAHV